MGESASEPAFTLVALPPNPSAFSALGQLHETDEIWRHRVLVRNGESQLAEWSAFSLRRNAYCLFSLVPLAHPPVCPYHTIVDSQRYRDWTIVEK